MERFDRIFEKTTATIQNKHFILYRMYICERG